MEDLIRRKLNIYDFNAVMRLFLETNKDNPYYKIRFPNESTRITNIYDLYSEQIKYILSSCPSDAIGVFTKVSQDKKGNWNSGKLVAFLIGFVYRVGDPYTETLGEIQNQQFMLGENNSIHTKLIGYNPTFYILSLCEGWGYKDKGLGFKLIEERISEFPNWNLAMDTTNKKYIKWGKKHGFILEPLDFNNKSNHTLMIHSKVKE